MSGAEERAKQEQRLRALATLMASDGWKLMAEMLNDSANMALHKLLKANDPTEMVRLQTAYKTLIDLPSWPLREGEAIKAWLKQTGET